MYTAHQTEYSRKLAEGRKVELYSNVMLLITTPFAIGAAWLLLVMFA